MIRDIVGLTGPKYGCGINVCKACTSHLNGKAFNPCSVRVADIEPTDEVTTIEGLRRHRRRATCTRCRRPGWSTTSRSAATASPARSWPPSPRSGRPAREGHEITDADLDEIRNVCRCGTYSRIREAIKAGATKM